MRILIVDDDALVCSSLKTILEAKNIQVDAIGNSGEEAIALYRQYQSDVLLMDIRMEKMNGVEASEAILKELSEHNEYGNILRAKGYVDSNEGEWLYFDLVPGEYQIRTGQADFTGRICVIGENVNADKLSVLFNEVN